VINELSDQNIKDRYFGLNDPVAKKIMRGLHDTKMPIPPADKSITSLFIGGVTDDAIREKDLISIFSKWGEIKNVKILLKNYCCFVTFVTREGAENAMENLFNKLMIKGQKYKLMWGRVQNEKRKEEDEGGVKSDRNNIQYQTECPLYDAENYIQKTIDTNQKLSYQKPSLLDVDSKPYYPSMDPNAMGGLLKNKRHDKKELIKKDVKREINNIEEIK